MTYEPVLPEYFSHPLADIPEILVGGCVIQINFSIQVFGVIVVIVPNQWRMDHPSPSTAYNMYQQQKEKEQQRENSW